MKITKNNLMDSRRQLLNSLTSLDHVASMSQPTEAELLERLRSSPLDKTKIQPAALEIRVSDEFKFKDGMV